MARSCSRVYVLLALASLALVATGSVTAVGNTGWTTLDPPGTMAGSFQFGVSMDTVGNPIIIGGYYGLGGVGHGTIYHGGTYDPLDAPAATGATFLYGFEGNEVTGRAVGLYVDAGGVYHGVEYLMSSSQPWETFDFPNATATGIKGAAGNVLVGYYTDASGHTHGFTNDVGGTGWATFDYAQSTRTLINGISPDGSRFVGSFRDAAGATHGYLDQAGVPSQLDFSGATSTWATGVDGSNIVGYYLDAGGLNHGFLWNEATSAWTPVDYPGATQTYVYGICGDDFVGVYKDSAGVSHGFAYVTPEPATLLLLAMGGLLIAWRRRA